MVVTQFDTAGQQLRRDVLGAPAVCSQVKANDDYASHWLGGLSAGEHPVLAVQVGLEAGKLRRYAIFVLEPQGPRELGRYTANMPGSEVHPSLWPRELAAAIAFPSG